MNGERDLVSWLQKQLPAIGDDVAVLSANPAADGNWLITGDHQIPGVHVPQDTPARVIADRLLRVNLSDIAAGGAIPRFAFLNLAVPTDYPVTEFMESLLQACTEHNTVLCGGDTSSAPNPVFSLVLLGTLAAGSQSPKRNLAQAGDKLWVGGTLGQSFLGRKLLEREGGFALASNSAFTGLEAELHRAADAAIQRHLSPQPQLELGQWLARQPRAAAIDLSDGLAIDLHRLIEQSQVGAEIDRPSLPLDRDLKPLSGALEIDPWEAALGGGEDYVLLFALPEETQPPADFAAVEIGEVVPGNQVWIRTNQDRVALPALGWDHLK